MKSAILREAFPQWVGFETSSRSMIRDSAGRSKQQEQPERRYRGTDNGLLWQELRTGGKDVVAGETEN